MTVSQPGTWKVTVCGLSGGHECPKSVVMGRKVAAILHQVVIGLDREKEGKHSTRK